MFDNETIEKTLNKIQTEHPTKITDKIYVELFYLYIIEPTYWRKNQRKHKQNT